MMQVQITISIRGGNDNTIKVDLFRREDANDLERELAHNIQDMLLHVMEAVRDELPGQVKIKIIDNP